MKRRRASLSSAKHPVNDGQSYEQLVTSIATLNAKMVARVATAANQALVLRNWLIGAFIVEFEQAGGNRAEYGSRLLETLAADLAKQGIKGLELRNLRNCRALYHSYPQIRQTLSAELLESPALIKRLEATSSAAADSASSVCRMPAAGAPASPTQLSAREVLELSWSQLLELMRITDPWKRSFYEKECLRGHWSVRQLQRQVGSLLFERTGLSTDKLSVVTRATQWFREVIFLLTCWLGHRKLVQAIGSIHWFLCHRGVQRC